MAENGNIVALVNYIIVTRKSSYSLKKPSIRFHIYCPLAFQPLFHRKVVLLQAENNITKAV